MNQRMKVVVTPELDVEDRKALSRYLQALKQERPTYFVRVFTFKYRGSTVTITPPAKRKEEL